MIFKWDLGSRADEQMEIEMTMMCIMHTTTPVYIPSFIYLAFELLRYHRIKTFSGQTDGRTDGRTEGKPIITYRVNTKNKINSNRYERSRVINMILCIAIDLK